MSLFNGSAHPLRVGVIGVGVMGQHHARLYAALPNADLVGVVDVDRPRAEAVAKRYCCAAFSDYADLLDEPLDAVSIAVPTALHHEVALACLGRGIHCLIEKPLAASMSECVAINALAARQGLIVMVGHIERFNPAVQALKDIIDFGTLGPILGVSALRVGPRPPRITDTGIMLDVGCHDIDLLTYLTDKQATEVKASATGPDANHGALAATIQLEFGLMRPGVVEMSWQYSYKNRRLTVHWEHCEGLLDFMRQQLIISNTIGATTVPVSRAEPLRRELEAFLEAVQHGGTSPVPGEHSLY
ncbi:MAG TPA: Gfo/Idh/MocA family oxidoreductase, partial [bacterium]|nr:Gfo/Idh/MocA family oxidoreductase [bacterium]